jgi:hypothetical protein
MSHSRVGTPHTAGYPEEDANRYTDVTTPEQTGNETS